MALHLSLLEPQPFFPFHQESRPSLARSRTCCAAGDNSTPPPTQPPDLYPFVGGERALMPDGLALHLADYLELVNWTGQAVREDKRAAFAEDLPPILTRLGITEQAWLHLATEFETQFCRWIGQPKHVQDVCLHTGQHWARCIRACRLLFPS
jgi:hypothetical protein